MKTYPAERLIRIALALSTEKDINALLQRILTEAMDITGCDGGTVYIREKAQLSFHLVVTRSKGVCLIRQGEADILPPVPLSRTHVCACAALDHRLINIADVYQAGEYDFSGPRRYDALNGYRTQSMLVVPMEDEQGRNIGVLQLINAMDGEGRVIPFDPAYESLFLALGSLAAISLNNTLLQRSVTDILHSFVAVMVDAVDARSPYNANHTRSMVHYAEKFIDWLDTGDYGWRFSPEEKDPFLMSVWLHDIGKLVIPLEIMDKPTRLGSLEQPLMARIEIGLLMERLRAFEHPQEAEDAQTQRQRLEEARQLLLQANAADALTEGMAQRLREISALPCRRSDGACAPLLTAEELDAITVRRGTLTDAERREMERHVVYTQRLLGKMKFSGQYQSVPDWASAHHELLDGSGYPAHLDAQRLPRPVRLLTILDIYDALTAEDRPYKRAMTAEHAFEILRDMRDAGKIDGEILSLFYDSGAWRKD